MRALLQCDPGTLQATFAIENSKQSQELKKQQMKNMKLERLIPTIPAVTSVSSYDTCRRVNNNIARAPGLSRRRRRLPVLTTYVDFKQFNNGWVEVRRKWRTK